MNLQNTLISLQELREMDFKDEHAYERAIWKYLTCIELPNFALTIPKGRIIFRTRTHPYNEDIFNKISDIGITPKQFIPEFGRCNRPSQSVFYASEDRITSYVELIQSWALNKTNDDFLYATTGVWKLKENMDVVIVTSPNKTERVSAFDRTHGEALDKQISELDGEYKQAIKEIYHFLFEIFRRPANGYNRNYILTAAFSNITLMHPEAGTNGIYYPSVPFEFQGINFAITESFASQYLELIDAFRSKFKVTINDNKKPTFEEIETIKSKALDLENNLIIWE